MAKKETYYQVLGKENGKKTCRRKFKEEGQASRFADSMNNVMKQFNKSNSEFTVKKRSK